MIICLWDSCEILEIHYTISKQFKVSHVDSEASEINQLLETRIFEDIEVIKMMFSPKGCS